MTSTDLRPLWLGRSADPPSALALELSSTRDVDLPLAPYDIQASRVHVGELLRIGLVDSAGAAELDRALTDVADAITNGTFGWHTEHEDVHMNVEAAVREVVGLELAGHLQAGRSRNEEVVTDERAWLKAAVERLDALLVDLQRALVRRAAEEIDTVLPAHTHTQPAQPVLLAHHLLAYAEMLERDRGRLADCAQRAD